MGSNLVVVGLGFVLGGPVTVTIRDTTGYIRVLLYSFYTTITAWGLLLMLRLG